MKRVRIGNGCGFWGDNLDAPMRLARDGRLDYLTLEYLAELTMSTAHHDPARPAGSEGGHQRGWNEPGQLRESSTGDP
jgi:Acyclic terpene utilisation family protein AtuA